MVIFLRQRTRAKIAQLQTAEPRADVINYGAQCRHALYRAGNAIAQVWIARIVFREARPRIGNIGIDSQILAAFARRTGDVATTLNANPPISIERLEWEHLQKILMESQGNISVTARRLGMHRRTLQRKLQKRPVRQ